MEERDPERRDDQVKLPDERVEDLEPTGEDSDEVVGGDITLKRGLNE